MRLGQLEEHMHTVLRDGHELARDWPKGFLNWLSTKCLELKSVSDLRSLGSSLRRLRHALTRAKDRSHAELIQQAIRVFQSMNGIQVVGRGLWKGPRLLSGSELLITLFQAAQRLKRSTKQIMVIALREGWIEQKDAAKGPLALISEDKIKEWLEQKGRRASMAWAQEQFGLGRAALLRLLRDGLIGRKNPKWRPGMPAAEWLIEKEEVENLLRRIDTSPRVDMEAGDILVTLSQLHLVSLGPHFDISRVIRAVIVGALQPVGGGENGRGLSKLQFRLADLIKLAEERNARLAYGPRGAIARISVGYSLSQASRLTRIPLERLKRAIDEGLIKAQRGARNSLIISPGELKRLQR
jgi:hypothetical protein